MKIERPNLLFAGLFIVFLGLVLWILGPDSIESMDAFWGVVPFFQWVARIAGFLMVAIGAGLIIRAL